MSNITFLNYKEATTYSQKFKLKKDANYQYQVSNFVKIISEDEDSIVIETGIHGKNGYIENGKFKENR